MKVLVTGSAGFIGFHVTQRLLERGEEVVGLDNLNAYYDVALKQARLRLMTVQSAYSHHQVDLADRSSVEALFADCKPDAVINLAAQAGVRYAAENPHVYVSSNVTGFLHVLEGCRQHAVKHLVFASTSSVYGANRRMPYSEHRSAEHPITLYAATKKANEAMAHSYAHLFGVPCSGLRFFTVYGPWSRPDMAPMLFARAILAGEPIRVFNHGKHRRSFTYIDDIVEGVIGVLDRPPGVNVDWDALQPDPATSSAPYQLLNIGNSQSVELLRFVEVLEKCLGRKAEIELLPMQAGDALETHADCDAIEQLTGRLPQVGVEEGVSRFVQWYRSHYG